ncbi:dethiobiotin synthase [Laspinema sp. D2d]|uniref:dethiobiotin synthase n=1 Tax=Laspinema sp. D2d TaxID=2953686 RepID=UPI0021BB6EBD|nr:dethiobiotin synthase [Laspinema sp. D2d]
MNALLISGTDTDAGKTLVTTAIAAYWQRYYPQGSLALMKPLQSGTGDRELYQRLFELKQSPEEITPLYFEAPLAPPVAAQREGRSVDLKELWPVFSRLQKRSSFVLVEGVGGLGSPISWELTVADLAHDWRIPTVLVVPVRLGAIAAAVANVALARQSAVPLLGIILNCVHPCSESEVADLTPIDLIESLTQTRILGTIPFLEDSQNLDQLVQVASNLDLELLLPRLPRVNY